MKFSIRKMNLLQFLGIICCKYRASEDNTIFLQEYFRFRGWGTFPLPPPGGAHAVKIKDRFASTVHGTFYIKHKDYLNSLISKS